MKTHRSVISLALTLVLALAAFAAAPVMARPLAHQPQWENPAYQGALLSVLAVNADGTLRITAWGEARQLLGRDYAQAVGDLNQLNAKILAGQVKGFRTVAELGAFGLTDPPAPVVNASTLCSRTCYRGQCCCRGWWIFCWGLCSC